MKQTLLSTLLRLSVIMAVIIPGSAVDASAYDSVLSCSEVPKTWSWGAQLTPSFVPGTNSYVRGNNSFGKAVHSCISADLRAQFSFDNDSHIGKRYKGVYQGLGLGINPFFPTRLLGSPVAVYVYQGAPLVSISPRWQLGAEWKFGAAMGWKKYDAETATDNGAVSTRVTAVLGVAIKFQYNLNERTNLFFGINADHFSNGNTSWPNAGVNTLGASVGVTCLFKTPDRNVPPAVPSSVDTQQAKRSGWNYDIMAYGAWRKRIVNVEGTPMSCPGDFGILGLQAAALHSFNRWISAGPALNIQWDESGSISAYPAESTFFGDLKFYRPPFREQLRIGPSLQAELTMPIFAINVGVGYDFVSPRCEKRFFQSLSLKTFVTDRLFLNTGYRLGSFKDPQNLILGIGVRL